MTVVNKIIHRFIQPRSEYMTTAGTYYDQIIPYNVQAYSYELKENGDPNIPDDYIVRYVLGTGKSTYKQIADGEGQSLENNFIPELSKEFLVNSSTQLTQIITDLIQQQVIDASYITSNATGDNFTTKAALDSATTWYSAGTSVTPKKNDYVIVLADETHTTGSGTNPTTKYVCTSVTNNIPTWDFQYIINNGNFTPTQQAAIDSGITAAKVATYDSYATQIAEALDHLTDYNNPHQVSKAQLGLSNVDNTKDADKPISTATQTALDEITDILDTHTEDTTIHVTASDKANWSSKQNVLSMGNHISISNNTISVLDDLSTYDNTVSKFIQKSSDDLDNYYTKAVIDEKFEDVPISQQTQEALDELNDKIDEHIEDEDIHVTATQKNAWTNKQNNLTMGNHIKISNNVISVLDDLSTYNNTIAQFVNKDTSTLTNYYTKEQLEGVYKYLGTVATVDDLPLGNLYAPNTYVELQYLTADQLEYINTQYYPNQNTQLTLKFKINDAGNNYLYGTNLEGVENKVAFGINYGATIADAFFGNQNATSTIDNQIHTLIQNKDGIYLDGTQVGTYTDIEDFITTTPLWLFRAQTSDTHPQNINIYEFIITESSQTIAHYVPVKRRSDNALGMYEVVSTAFKQNEYNPTEFDFTPGPVAGYGNQNGSVYKVLSNGVFYMWYDHQWISMSYEVTVDGITIIRNSSDASLTATGVKTKSNDIMYDWVGTLAEWTAGRTAGTIPDSWVCWITDDEETPAGIASLAQVASTGSYNDLVNKPTLTLPSLPSGSSTTDYTLKWDHTTQSLVWVAAA